MNSTFLRQFVRHECEGFDVVVLKGFSPELILSMKDEFALIDEYVIQNNKIILENINEQQLMFSIIGQQPHQKLICTCESFIKLCTQIQGLGILNKKICVLENNFFELYPNPTNQDIPDFDSDDFMNSDDETPIYSVFYSYCICSDGEQRVQYIDNYSTYNSCVSIKYLAEPKPFVVADYVSDSEHVISTKDGSLNCLMETLYNDMASDVTEFAVESEEVQEERVLALVEAGKMFGCNFRIFKINRDSNVPPRQDLIYLLRKIWGYPSFRDLKIYKDLNMDHSVTDISQGSVVEMVVRQAEYAFQGENTKVNNVLLTSPTGAGKSLLFQLSAIYLAEKYGLLTIIVSPLVALMNDQVDGLPGYDGVASLNSNKTAADKASILKGVLEGSINLLYLSPELLLSYSITTFIGNRKLGLLVVDEAHTVTTWGRDFRVDYWFLGDYLRKAKRVLKYQFPIFALTATAVWDPSGRNDMVFDTIRSLNMDPCIKYIGVVRRSNITFEILQSNITKNYEEKRRALTISRIREAIANDRKTIVYFPFRRTVDNIVHGDDILDIKEKIAYYHAGLFPEEKTKNAEDFRLGIRPIICATKAFGMGIDVPDICEVYHHAPTGCLSDYVQEIGRLARNPQINGIAKIDFSPNDFRYIRKLHGLSAIKPYQLRSVLQKLMSLYRINGEKRNMLISSDDFAHIFPLSSPDNVDQSLKSCLLLISNDLLNKLRFHALIVRPKSLFSKCYVQISSDEAKDFYRLYHDYLKHIDNDTFVLDADKIWTERYSSVSFPQFKRKLAEGKVFKDFNVELKNKVVLQLHSGLEETKKRIEEFFHLAHGFLNEMSSQHHRIGFSLMKESLPPTYDGLKREQFLETFRMLYVSSNALGGNVAAFCSVFISNEGDKNGKESFQLMQSGFENVANLYFSAFDRLVTNTYLTVYCKPQDPIVKLSEFLNCLGLADYQRLGGDQPAIFVRINNPYHLNMLVRSKNYENDILNSIYEKYKYSERVFSFFFTTPMTNKQRWDFIEEYFLGASEERLLNFVK